MPYTLAMGLVWFALAALVGLVVGWLLRSVAARRQVERARSANVGAVELDELERLRGRVAALEPLAAERDELRAELDRQQHQPAAAAAEPSPTGAASGDAAPGDMAAAAAVLGRPIDADDLTVIDGIDADVARLCQGIGISTWAELSVTEVSLLRTMLHEAGADGAGHDPQSWPTQARLLAAGAWDEFASVGTHRAGDASD